MAQSDLPGFYLHNNRYYKLPRPGGPSASQRHAAPRPSTSAAEPARKRKQKRRMPSTAMPQLVAHSRSASLLRLPRLSHNMRLAHYAGVASDELLLPDCMYVDDTITSVCVDGADPGLLRIGTMGGSLFQGKRDGQTPTPVYEWDNVSSWRLDWQFASPTRALRSHGSRFLAASFGPPASAMFATSEASASLASVVLNPRQTSIWSCALASGWLALGCDHAVLLSHDPLSSAMQSLKTGSAVLALQADNNTLAYGLRSGLVRLVDVRSKGDAETSLQLDAPVTHLERKPDTADLVTATFGGGLRVYDVRNLAKPRHTLRGHRNTCSTDLGLTLCDDLLVAAGDDSMVRGWSMRSGEPLRPTTGAVAADDDDDTARPLFGRPFDEPIRSLAYSAAHGREGNMLYLAIGGGLQCYVMP